MLRVTVEIIPMGNEESKRVVGLVEIEHVGGDRDVGDYEIRFEPIDRGRATVAKVFGHIRSRGMWPLIARAARAHTRAR